MVQEPTCRAHWKLTLDLVLWVLPPSGCRGLVGFALHPSWMWRKSLEATMKYKVSTHTEEHGRLHSHVVNKLFLWPDHLWITITSGLFPFCRHFPLGKFQHLLWPFSKFFARKIFIRFTNWLDSFPSPYTPNTAVIPPPFSNLLSCSSSTIILGHSHSGHTIQCMKKLMSERIYGSGWSLLIIAICWLVNADCCNICLVIFLSISWPQ